ncbi:MAG: VanZ family protein [Planctomycetota bacterium]
MPSVPLGVRRGVFLAYAVVLFTATHWPSLKIDGPVPRTDLWLHVGAFGAWTLLFGFAEFIGRWRDRTTPLRLIACGIVYAAMDELLQAIPVLNRFATIEDYVANLVGVFAGATIILIAARNTEPGPDGG